MLNSDYITINSFKKTKKNRINFEPEEWGKYAWPFLYSTAFGYPQKPTKEEKQSAKNFFTGLMAMIACSKCRNNSTSHLKKYPLTDEVLANRTNLITWLYNVNNEINKMLNKKTYSLDETVSYYYNKLKNSSQHISTQKQQPEDTFGRNIIIVMIVFATLLLLFLLYLKKK